MKIIVFSDSHNNICNMINILKVCKSDTSLVVHLGDTTTDCKKLQEKFPDLPFISVKGNNDFFDVETNNECIYNLEGINCFFTHGHQYGVKNGLNGIAARARAIKADIVFFGHTHLPTCVKHNNTLFLNPGSIGEKYNYLSTFAIVHLNAFAILSADIMVYDPINKKIDFYRK